MARLRKRVFIPVANFAGWQYGGGSPGGIEGGVPTLVGMGSLALSGAKWLVTETDILYTAIPLPNDADYTGNMGFRVFWFADADGTFVPTVTWAVTVATAARGAEIGVYGALDTPIASDASEGGTTDNCLSVTERGILNLSGTTYTQALADTGKLLSIGVAPAVQNTLTALYMYGIEYDYAVVPDAALTKSYYSQPYTKS